NGHTMVIVGQCGQVIAPTRPGDGAWYLEFFADAEAIPLSTIKAGVDVTWESVGEYLDALGKKRGINVGTLVGHSGIRRYVMGEASSERAEATPEELATMQRLVREAMQAGALGFSTAPARRRDPAGGAPHAGRSAPADVGRCHVPAVSGADGRLPRPGHAQGAERRGGGGHRRPSRSDDRPAGAGARLFQPALGPRAGLFGHQEAAPGAPGQERRAHRQ